MTESEQDGDLRAAPGVSRRTMLLGAGAVGAAGMLAGCGSSNDPPASPNPNPNPAPSPKSPSASAGKPAEISTAEIPVGGGKVFPERQLVVTQPTAGTFKAFDAICTHQQCTVGNVTNGKIICPCHGSQYNIADGSVAQGPAPRPLAPKTATVANGSITVS
jgi:Rieske Fe-S protein